VFPARVQLNATRSGCVTTAGTLVSFAECATPIDIGPILPFFPAVENALLHDADAFIFIDNPLLIMGLVDCLMLSMEYISIANRESTKVFHVEHFGVFFAEVDVNGNPIYGIR
jgi:hypothetical protein